MNEEKPKTANPYRTPRSPEGSTRPPRRRKWPWWLVIVGVLLMAGGAGAPVVAFTGAFDAVAESPDTPSPAELAAGIHVAGTVTVAAIGIGLLGLATTVVGILLLVFGPKTPHGNGTPT